MASLLSVALLKALDDFCDNKQHLRIYTVLHDSKKY